jgi:aspartyl-tRNA(Asn)/glutamyl-tRNA(Gln) amidotransferase subunit A
LGELNPKAQRCRLEAAHAHAAALGPALNAFVEIASPASSGIAGPLSGLPYAAKDMFRTPTREPGCGFGTGFEGFSDPIARLAAAGADLVGFTSIIVTGGSTSGCVRATVVDSLSQLPHHRPRGMRCRQA